jgi:GNAT superfamily N-acetyltransferase
MQSVALDKNIHDRKRFDCGITALNHYLRLAANQQSRKDNSRTFVFEDPTDHAHIIGYYTLTMVPVDPSKLPDKLQKRHNNVPAGGLIARLAVDQRYSRQGFGAWLLIDALKKLLIASQSVAFPFIVVDAKPDATAFYKKYGFRAFHDTPDKLFITVADVRANIT